LRPMPKIMVLGSCKLGPYEIIFVPNKLDPELYERDHELAYIEACKKVYPAIVDADEIWVYAPNGIGEHTRRDLAYAESLLKKIRFIKEGYILDMQIMINCAGCKKYLGIYQGERFWIAPAKAKVGIYCNKCYAKKVWEEEAREP